jgi:peroxidase
MARSIVTAEYQTIVYREYLPVLIGSDLGAYRGYDPSIDAQVTQEFSTAAFRVGHSQVSEQQTGIDNHGVETFTQSLAQAFFNTASEDLANGIDPLLRNLSAEASQATDVFSVPTLRNLLFAPLAGGNVDQVDLIAIDIQRERDVGLNTLNATRTALRLRPYTSFTELTSDPVLQALFRSVYGDIDAVDLFMGGLAEAHAPGAAVGPTFQAIIRAQFEALRSGDRFFWQNQQFDAETARAIAATTLSDILRRNTDSTSLPDQVFVLAAPEALRVQKPQARPGTVDNHGRRGRPFITP